MSVRSFLIAATTRYSGFFLLSLVTRFACDIGNWQRFGFEFHLRSSPSAYSGFCEYQSTSGILHSLLHRAEETQQGRNSCPPLQFGVSVGLYRVVAPSSFPRSISLTSLFTSYKIASWFFQTCFKLLNSVFKMLNFQNTEKLISLPVPFTLAFSNVG